MNHRDYLIKTARAVEVINTVSQLFGIEMSEILNAQESADTSTIISALNIAKKHIDREIEHIKTVDEEYKDDLAYETFVNECRNADESPRVLSWNDIPNKARAEIYDNYKRYVRDFGVVTNAEFGKYMTLATEQFKRKYNIDKIKL